MAKDNTHAAYASATGYLYQARLALLLAIQAIDSTPDREVRIETFDDISFGEAGEPVELIQTKHHGTGGSLTNASVDLWKTLRIWAKRVAASADPLPALVLMTTGKAPTGSAASLLKVESRDEAAADKLLLNVCDTSSNETNRTSYQAYEALNASQRMRLLRAITVLDGASDILDVRDEIAQAVRLAAPRSRINQFVERLEGWWFGLVIAALAHHGGSIKVLSVDARIDELREDFQRAALPIDHASTVPPAEIVADLDTRPFVQQLRKIKVGSTRIEYAMRDYYRASEQRARWAREDLLVDGELKSYERELKEAWEPRFADMVDELPDGCDSTAKAAAGAAVYRWVEQEAILPLRSLTNAFLTKGSYHMLANQYVVGWHPDFLEDAPNEGERK